MGTAWPLVVYQLTWYTWQPERRRVGVPYSCTSSQSTGKSWSVENLSCLSLVTVVVQFKLVKTLIYTSVFCSFMKQITLIQSFHSPWFIYSQQVMSHTGTWSFFESLSICVLWVICLSLTSVWVYIHYLHLSMAYRAILATLPKLDGSNWFEWKKEAETILLLAGLDRIIDAADTPTGSKATEWNSKDCKLYVYLFFLIKPNYYAPIIEIKSSQEAWKNHPTLCLCMLFEAACVEPIGTVPAISLLLLVWLPHIEAASLTPAQALWLVLTKH